MEDRLDRDHALPQVYLQQPGVQPGADHGSKLIMRRLLSNLRRRGAPKICSGGGGHGPETATMKALARWEIPLPDGMGCT